MSFWSSQRQPGGLFTYKGRINRKRYAIWYVLLNILIMAMMIFIATGENLLLMLLLFALQVCFVLMYVLNAVRRLHDLNYPGWPAVAYAFFVIFLSLSNISIFGITAKSGFVLGARFGLEGWLLVKKGTDGPNQYGNDPLQKEAAEAT